MGESSSSMGMSMKSGGKMGGSGSYKSSKGMSMESKGKSSSGMSMKSKGSSSAKGSYPTKGNDDYVMPSYDDYVPDDDAACCEKWMVSCEEPSDKGKKGNKKNKHGREEICTPYCAVPCSDDDYYYDGRFEILGTCTFCLSRLTLCS